jgi:pheromone shutdown protein TraB
MASWLSALRREGDVVAVVGVDHLDDVTAHLERGLTSPAE